MRKSKKSAMKLTLLLKISLVAMTLSTTSTISSTNDGIENLGRFYKYDNPLEFQEVVNCINDTGLEKIRQKLIQGKGCRQELAKYIEHGTNNFGEARDLEKWGKRWRRKYRLGIAGGVTAAIGATILAIPGDNKVADYIGGGMLVVGGGITVVAVIF